MMGRESPPQVSLFYTAINIEKRIRSDHVLRKVARLVDFDFVYTEVKESHGYNVTGRGHMLQRQRLTLMRPPLVKSTDLR